MHVVCMRLAAAMPCEKALPAWPARERFKGPAAWPCRVGVSSPAIPHRTAGSVQTRRSGRHAIITFFITIWRLMALL